MVAKRPAHLKFNQKQFDAKNKAELRKISKWLKQGPKVMLQAAVTRAHSAVMQSDNMGGRMMHDSSNAAYNWRISIDGSIPAVLWAKGKSPVGDEGDQRTREGKSFEIMKTISARIIADTKKLDRAVWGAASISKVSLVNPIHGYYAVNANLDEASAGSLWRQYAEQAADQAFKSWMAAGPNVDWSKQSLAMFGGGNGY